jgi:hypothetical protein
MSVVGDVLGSLISKPKVPKQSAEDRAAQLKADRQAKAETLRFEGAAKEEAFQKLQGKRGLFSLLSNKAIGFPTGSVIGVA